MYTEKKSTLNHQSNTENREQAPVLRLQTGLRAGGPNSDEALIAANWDKIESWFNNLQAKFGTNI